MCKENVRKTLGRALVNAFTKSYRKCESLNFELPLNVLVCPLNAQLGVSKIDITSTCNKFHQCYCLFVFTLHGILFPITAAAAIRAT
jgi:hypothetical protein